MLSRICCLLLAPKSPKLIFSLLLATGIVITIGFLYIADFRQLFHGSVFYTSFEKRAAFEHNVIRFRPYSICPSEGLDTTATIFVISSPENVVRRQVIRSTWGHPEVTQPLGLGVVFIVGEAKDSSVGRLVDWESEAYGNIVQPTFADNYQSLSLKTLTGLRWVIEYCSKSSFVIKVDDDVFINVYALKKFLRHQNRDEAALMCLVWDKMPTIHRKGDKTADQFNATIYPTYCSGSAYIMSLPVARSLSKASLTMPIFSPEDVFVTGILAKEARVLHKQIGYMYSFKSRNTKDLAEGKIIFAHLDDEKSIPVPRMWEEVFAFENN